MEKVYAAIDLKSFYASVECIERGLDPLTTHLVVADRARTEKTICLAVSPSLKAYGIPGRARLFEVVQAVERLNAERRCKAPACTLAGASHDATVLAHDPSLALDYIAAPPRMALYLDYSTRIYDVYLRYVAPEDIHVYSIDEVFIDMTPYLKTYGLSARELTSVIVRDVLAATGITATAGVGTNLYLCKVAMDIVAKHIPPNADGVRVAELNEVRYRQLLWEHEPLTDFWRIGRGYQKKLASYHLHTMGDIARCSLQNAWLLYKLFGVNAELLIDHAWGIEPCTMADIKAYRPAAHGTSVGQVLTCAYTWEKARLIVREMADQLALDLVAKGVCTDQLVLTVGYDIANLTDPTRAATYTGAVTVDGYGRRVPKAAHGTVTLDVHTSSTTQIVGEMLALFDRITDRGLLVRRITMAANRLQAYTAQSVEQLSLFEDPAVTAARQEAAERERHLQEAILGVRARYGKNALFKGMDLEDGATARERNAQIGGHKA